MKKYLLIIVTFFVSSIFHIFLRGVGIHVAIGAIVFQLFGSMIFGYVISMFVSKYKENDWVHYWKIMYVIMITINLLSHYLEFMPSV